MRGFSGIFHRMKNFELLCSSIGIHGSQSNQNDEVKTFVVYGVPRGGTTMVARVVDYLGVPMGQNLPSITKIQILILTKCQRRLSLIVILWIVPYLMLYIIAISAIKYGDGSFLGQVLICHEY